MKAAKLVPDKLGKHGDRRDMCDISNRNLMYIIASACCYEVEECMHQDFAAVERKSIINHPFHTVTAA